MNDAKEKVKIPAIALLVTAVIGILAQCGSIVRSIIIMVQGAAVATANMSEQDKQVQQITAAISGPVGIVFSIIGLAVAGFVIFAALKMQKLESYGMAMTAAILTIVPCTSPCYCVGLFTGIWAVVVLMNQDVKAAFQNKAMG